jgi:hypothetical protein
MSLRRLFSDFSQLLWRVYPLERLRVSVGPNRAVLLARRLGQKAMARSVRDRRALVSVISVVDRFCVGGPNCYRRVLLEVAMDAGAAREVVKMGFRSSGGQGSGHAWLGDAVAMDGRSQPYDAIVSI